MTVATVQPIGHDSQMPVSSKVRDRTKASATRSSRSVNVEAMNGPIFPAPRRTPSATIFEATIT